VKAANDNEDWRKKYFDSLRSLEGEERQFRAAEAVLKKLVGRLCLASQGQSARLDDELKKLQAALRGDAASDVLDALAPAITDAVHALDHSMTLQPKQPVPAEPSQAQPPLVQPLAVFSSTTATRAPPGEAIMGDDGMRATLAALLAQLRRDPELLARCEALDAQLAISLTREQLPALLASLAELVALRIQRIEKAKQEVEALLAQMVAKLDEIARFVVEQNQNQNQSMASSESLNKQLAGEVQAMGESVDAAIDLPQLRQQVRTRIEAIGRHMQEFRQRESDRDTAIRERNDHMRARVEQLEGEASKLHARLEDEQRLSSIDGLTQIPNRWAYEQRIAAELLRWRRFAQPTCIAAWDVDYFKRVNDTYGHRAGDRVLKAVAEVLSTSIRSTDFVARYGGEEFVMILAGANVEQATRMLEAMRIAVSGLRLHFRGTPVSVTISVGVTAFRSGDTVSDVFDRADKALYMAKEDGRNRCVNR
jgi:diguanylate cyclase